MPSFKNASRTFRSTFTNYSLKKNIKRRSESGAMKKRSGSSSLAASDNAHLPRAAAEGLSPDLNACGVNVTPPCIRALYEIPRAHYCQPENVQGLYQRGDVFAQADIDAFFKKFAPYIPQGTSPTVASIDGGTAPIPVNGSNNGGESDLDLDLAYSLIYPQSVTIYQVDDKPQSAGVSGKGRGLFNTFLDAVDGSYCNYTAYG